MKSPRIPTPSLLDDILLPTPPSQWPRTRAGVIEVSNAWYDASKVAINEGAIELLPQGTITPIAVEENVLGTTPATPGKYVDVAEATIALGAINHMFWEQQDGQFTRYEHNGQVGAMAMTAAFEQAWADPVSPLRLARYHGVPLTAQCIREVFGDIPVPESRVVILNQILLSEDLTHLAEVAQRTGQAGDPLGVEFAARLADAFPLGYGDEVLKKAQLTTSGLWRQARQAGSVSMCDVTAFADYQIPNVLRALGLLDYSPELAARIDRGELIEANGAEERAIRAASILGVELLAKQQNVDVADVDYWLWLKRKEPQTPFHRTRTTLY